MRVLLDTHLLIWAARGSARLPSAAAVLIEDPESVVLFSAAAIWEVAVKSGLGRAAFQIDPTLFRAGLRDAGHTELPITGVHAAAVRNLPPIHKDPFDRILVAQAQVEGALLLTVDKMLSRYPGPIRLL